VWPVAKRWKEYEKFSIVSLGQFGNKSINGEFIIDQYGIKGFLWFGFG